MLHTFRQVDRLLHTFQALWRMQPMRLVCDKEQPATLLCVLNQVIPEAPETARALGRSVGELSSQQVEEIDASAIAQKKFFSTLLPQVMALDWLIEPPPVSSARLPIPFWLTNGIGGRKLSQIESFIAHTPELSGTVAEWCAGKGHLGRLLSYNGIAQQQRLSIVSLEWQSALCDRGAQLAQKFDLPQTFQQTDVLSDAGTQALSECNHAVALHACGDLHRKLLEQSVASHLQSVWVAPCCYHLTSQATYRPMSKVAQQSGLAVSREELKLAVQGQVTAGERISALRETEVTWRIVYQLLRERHTNADTYRALPSVPKQWFSGSLENFVKWGCEHHGWSLPAGIDWPALLIQARQRYQLLKQLDLIRHAFRRPLELWLVLDRALFMQEQGYEVTLQAFCAYQSTPRNLLISARCSEN